MYPQPYELLIAALNRWGASRFVRPFTCANDIHRIARSTIGVSLFSSDVIPAPSSKATFLEDVFVLSEQEVSVSIASDPVWEDRLLQSIIARLNEITPGQHEEGVEAELAVGTIAHLYRDGDRVVFSFRAGAAVSVESLRADLPSRISARLLDHVLVMKRAAVMKRRMAPHSRGIPDVERCGIARHIAATNELLALLPGTEETRLHVPADFSILEVFSILSSFLAVSALIGEKLSKQSPQA